MNGFSTDLLGLAHSLEGTRGPSPDVPGARLAGTSYEKEWQLVYAAVVVSRTSLRFLSGPAIAVATVLG